MEWDPCGDDFGYAEKWSKQFIDANDFTEKYKTKSCLERANNGQGCTSRRTSRQIPKTTLFRKLARIQMSLKNNDVGRQVKYSLNQWTRDSRTISGIICVSLPLPAIVQNFHHVYAVDARNKARFLNQTF